MSTHFLKLGDQLVNMTHVQVLRRVSSSESPCGTRISLDLGNRVFSWDPQSLAEVEWLEQAVGLLRPGDQLPVRAIGELPELRSAVQTPARTPAPPPPPPLTPAPAPHSEPRRSRKTTL